MTHTGTPNLAELRTELGGLTVVMRHPDSLDAAARSAAAATSAAILDGVSKVGLFGAETIYRSPDQALPIWGALITRVDDAGWPPLEAHVDGDIVTYLRRLAAGRSNTPHPIPGDLQSGATRLLAAMQSQTTAATLMAVLNNPSRFVR